MVKGKSASVALCNSSILSVKVITLTRSCSDLYEDERTCLKMIKEQPRTQPLMTVIQCMSSHSLWITAVCFCLGMRLDLNYKQVLSSQLLKTTKIQRDISLLKKEGC